MIQNHLEVLRRVNVRSGYHLIKVFETMCDGECDEHEITIAEQMFLHHIDQLKRDKNRDVGRIAAVLLEAHVFIRQKFHSLQVTLYQDQGTISWRFDEIFLYNNLAKQ